MPHKTPDNLKNVNAFLKDVSGILSQTAYTEPNKSTNCSGATIDENTVSVNGKRIEDIEHELGYGSVPNEDNFAYDVYDANNDMTGRIFDARIGLINKVVNKDDKLDSQRAKARTFIFGLLISELIFTGLLIGFIFYVFGFTDYDKEVFLNIMGFLKYYIGAIIVEFISIVFFIVKYLHSNKLIDVLMVWFEKIDEPKGKV